MILQNVILGYNDMYEPKQYQGAGSFRYGAKFIFPEGFDFADLLAELAQKRAEAGLPETSASPLRQLTDGPNAGKWELGSYNYADNNNPPQVVDSSAAPLLDRASIFAGCIVHASVDLYAYKAGKGGIAAGFQHVMLVSSDQPRLDSAQTAQQAFAGVTSIAPAAVAPVAPAAVAPVAPAAVAPVAPGAPS